VAGFHRNRNVQVHEKDVTTQQRFAVDLTRMNSSSHRSIDICSYPTNQGGAGIAWVGSVRARAKSQHSDLHGSPLESLNGPLAAHFETVTAIRSAFEEAGIEVVGPLSLPVFASIGARCLKICRRCHELPGGPRLIALPPTNSLCCDHLVGDMDPARSIPDATVVEIRDVSRLKLSAASAPFPQGNSLNSRCPSGPAKDLTPSSM
jgi:hypothetical protein